MSDRSGAPRPQAVLLTVLADYVGKTGLAVSAGGLIEVLERVGFRENATRAAISRMAAGDLVTRHRRGRRAYLEMTERALAITRAGEIRAWEPVDHPWDGTWTLLGFSMPASWQQARHSLRSRLVWAGFGLLHSGLWIAPSTVDVDEMLAGLDVSTHVAVFSARPFGPTDIAALISEAYDLTGLSERYRRFVAEWADAKHRGSADPLATKLRLQAEWLQLVRTDPRIPLAHLPHDWPAVRAEAVFRELFDALRIPSERMASMTLDLIDVGVEGAHRSAESTVGSGPES